MFLSYSRFSYLRILINTSWHLRHNLSRWMKENDILNYDHILMMDRKINTIKFTNKHYETSVIPTENMSIAAISIN